MDHPSRSPIESRERAVSSDPCSTRPNPFDDDDGASARKRRRTSLNGASSSRSVESATSPRRSPDSSGRHRSVEQDASMTMDFVPSEPQTPENHQEPLQTASGSKPTRITLNLKNRKGSNHAIPTSPISLGDLDPALVAAQENGIRLSVEDSDLEVSHASPDFADTGSLNSEVDNPPIEILDDDEESRNGEPPLKFIQDTDMDPMINFPFATGDPVEEALQKWCQVIMTNAQTLNAFRTWLDDFLLWAIGKDTHVLIQHYMQYREFWELLPMLILHSTSPNRNPIPRHIQFQDALCELHRSFARLTALFVDLDRTICQHHPDGEELFPDRVSTTYIAHLAYLLNDYALDVAPNMSILDFESIWPEKLTRILEGFRTLQPPSDSESSINSLYQLGQLLAKLVVRLPRLVEGLSGIVQLASFLAQDEASRSPTTVLAGEPDPKLCLLPRGYKLYQSTSSAFASCIEKSVNQISHEVATILISSLTDLLRTSLRAGSEGTSDVLQQHQSSHPGFSAADSVRVIVGEWRLKTLTKLIMSSQMQLRIMAAQHMCSDLVRIWKDYHELAFDPSHQPVLNHFSRELLRSNVVAYVLGPTCHPEVTAQSGNIVGFLFATHTFTEEHMNFMWHTVTTCQISGVSESLLTMLTAITHLFGVNDLLCVCRKMQSVSIEAFTPTMKELCDKVLRHLMDRQEPIHDILPYSLMFRILRESSAPGPQFYRTVQYWASVLIPLLLRHGPSTEDRMLLYQDCLNDITMKTRFTLGSLHGLWLLCRPVSRELEQLTSQYNLPQLLVEELQHAISSRDDSGISNVLSGPENGPRLELLMSVILHGLDALTEDLGKKLWDLLVGKLAASQEDRDCAWLGLNSAMKQNTGNRFLKICFESYFPTLPPELFLPGALDFILLQILPLVDKEHSLVLDDEESGDQLAVEQLWRVALTAPNGTIERRAIITLVKDVYMDSRSIQSMPLHRAKKVHLALVDRCMRQLSLAAKELTTGDDVDVEAMDVNINGSQTSDQKLLFTRSLAIVREFHKIHQQTARFSSPDVRSLILPEKNDVQGDSAELKFQSFDGETQTEVLPLKIGRHNTAGSLLASLRDATGFNNYRLYYKGQPFLPTEQDICKSLEDLRIHNGLILVKRESDAVEVPVHVRAGASPVEIEIMRHFEELFQYLELQENLATEIYAFLVTLPVDNRILEILGQDAMTYRTIFPIGQPLKSLYALHATREYLNLQCSLAKSRKKNVIYERALRRALGLVVPAICDSEVIDSGYGADLKAALTARLVEQLRVILRDPLRPQSAVECLDGTLVERLLDILTSCLMEEPTTYTTNLVTVTFQAILDTCSLSSELWCALNSQVDIADIVQKLLIDDSRDVVRRLTANAIGDKITRTLSSSAVPAIAFRDFFWPVLEGLIPHALSRPTTCFQAFNLAVVLLKSARISGSHVSELPKTVESLGLLLLNYKPTEVAGMAQALSPTPPEDVVTLQEVARPGAIDFAAHGLVNLLCYILSDNDDQAVLAALSPSFGSDLFWRHLFPRRWMGSDLLWQGGLIYNETTRFRLNSVILKLSGRDLSQLRQLLQDLKSLVPCKTNDDSENTSTPPFPLLQIMMMKNGIPFLTHLEPAHYLTHDIGQYQYELPFFFDRSKEIRAPNGYAGLKNLSNTCYLNSLCTQLFMNVGFRKFMLNVKVDRTEQSRALLYHTQVLFSRLQSDQRRFVDPEDFVASIKTYDDEQINVHNQMDVEEFFNLLNDRWEGQLRSQEAIRQFRSFYGGQLVTQTKSKECDHISEVMEPFSAIQCDIKGKKDLLESLEAYVEGEHMEGDNRYKCSTCDRHVDAVRRSCLKEIPDSLIFHLKRFDFNLRTLSRSKINDYFAFPNRVNMRPYTIEHLSNSTEYSSEDWFELVGVLVHAGTAESGHYYSFIRERPTSRKDENWFEFNDDVVAPWNPEKLEACCFGGTESSWDAGGVTYEKNYCAYMLFYERASVLAKKQQELEQLNCSSPVQVRIPAPLEGSIREDNLRTLRRHCLFDPDHIRIVDGAIERMMILNNGQCSDTHRTEDVAIEMVLGHIDQVASRGKDVTNVQKLTDRVNDMASSCGRCALSVYEYFSHRHDCFKQLVQRNPEPVVRRAVANTFIVALCSIKKEFPKRYEDEDMYATTPFDELQEDVVSGACAMFDVLWDSFHLASLHRSWPEVFGMMAKFVELGKAELVAFLDRDSLTKTLLIFVAPELPDREKDIQFIKFCNTLVRKQNRPPCYDPVIELLSKILMSIPVETPVPSRVHRLKAFIDHPDEPIRLTQSEFELLHKELEEGGNVVLDKIIYVNENTQAVDTIVTHILEQQWSLERQLFDTLRYNTTPQAPLTSHAQYLRVASLCCRLSYDAEGIEKLIKHMARHSRALTLAEPKSMFKFWKKVIDGPRYNSGESAVSIHLQCLRYLPAWVPPFLIHYDPSVSDLAEKVLYEQIFQFGTDPEFENGQKEEGRAEAVRHCARSVGKQCLEYINSLHVSRPLNIPAQTIVVVQRVLTLCGNYFGNADEAAIGEAENYMRGCQAVAESLRRMSVDDDLEDDGSDWENSIASSDQMDSLADDEIKEMDL